MITCQDFVLNYNELFKFLEEQHGVAEVEKLWAFIADNYFEGLKERIREKGLKGVSEYWMETFSEEGDLFRILSGENSVQVIVDDCSSVRKLRNTPHVQGYPDYCRHCEVMYGRFFSSLGYDFKIEFVDKKLGKSKMTVSTRR